MESKDATINLLKDRSCDNCECNVMLLCSSDSRKPIRLPKKNICEHWVQAKWHDENPENVEAWNRKI